MIRDNKSGGYSHGRLRSALALILVLCIAVSGTALGATSIGGQPSDITPNAYNRPFIKLSKAVIFFTGATYATGATVSPALGTVWQLLSDDFYTSSVDGKEYYGVFYNNTRYNVLKSDVQGDIMTSDALISYVKNVLWAQPSYPTLKKELNLTGDIRVYGLQYALSSLGYYTSALDGGYGDKTVAAVKAFQRANKLDDDGRAGPITQAVLYKLLGGTGGSGTVTPTTPTGSTGTLSTLMSVNLRKNASKGSAKLAVVPKGVKLAYADTYVTGGVPWYKVTYNSITGWLMGTFVNAGGTSSGGGSSGTVAIGTVLITAAGTRVRKTANGAKTGTVLAKGTTVELLASPVSTGGYTWYNIRTSAGLVGFVRGDCATATMGGGGTITPSNVKKYIRLPYTTALFTTDTKPATGSVMVNAGTVLQMVSEVTYTSGNETYCSLYYDNTKYNAVYNEVKAGIMNDSELAAYVLTLWNGVLESALKQEFQLVGDVRVYAMQLALSALGYYTAALDGNFGGGSASAVRNFQRKNKLEVDGSCGNITWAELTKQARAVSGGGSSSGGGTGGVVTTDFGTVNSVEMATWTTVDGGTVSLFKKGTTAKVLDVLTGKVFTIYRWSGGSHADCVPYTASDTKTMCDAVGFPYNSSHPTNSQLAQIKADCANDNATYTWPDFGNGFGSGMDIGSAWDRRAALLNVDGRVFAVSIYGYPHGFNGTDSFAKSQFPNGQYFYAQNNFYGMMCLHFVGSKTHGGSTIDAKHQASIQAAYNYAKSLWPTLCK